LRDFKTQGSGGTGRVSSAEFDSGKVLATKFSWPTTRDAVLHECTVLHHLESFHVSGVEKCLASCTAPETFAGGGESDTEVVVAVLEPYFNPPSPPTAVLSDERLSIAAKATAVRGLATTVVQMLLAGVASSDFQPLIDSATGDTLLIDLSEGVMFADRQHPSAGELQLAQSFLSEFLALVSAASTSDDEVQVLLDVVSDTARHLLPLHERVGADEQASDSALVALIEDVLIS
jgi:hypothetical protein